MPTNKPEVVLPDYEEPVYACQHCGHEDHPDAFGEFCPMCGTDLDEDESP